MADIDATLSRDFICLLAQGFSFVLPFTDVPEEYGKGAIPE